MPPACGDAISAGRTAQRNRLRYKLFDAYANSVPFRREAPHGASVGSQEIHIGAAAEAPRRPLRRTVTGNSSNGSKECSGTALSPCISSEENTGPEFAGRITVDMVRALHVDINRVSGLRRHTRTIGIVHRHYRARGQWFGVETADPVDLHQVPLGLQIGDDGVGAGRVRRRRTGTCGKSRKDRRSAPDPVSAHVFEDRPDTASAQRFCHR